MRNPRPGLLLWIGAAGLLLAAIPSTAAGPADLKACRSCHAANTLAGSVHSTLSCTDCHAVAAAPVAAAAFLTKDGKPVPHAKTLPPVDCTLKCHHAAGPSPTEPGPTAYADSVHGQGSKRGEKEAARCWDCHGKHNIKPLKDPASVVGRANIPLVCSRCHENMSVVVKYNIHAESPYQEYKQSVHGRALSEKGLVRFAAVCTDCHGVHNIQGKGTPHIQARSPETCGACHVGVFAAYKESVHGREALKGNVDVPLCVDCHGEHRVAAARDAASPTSKKNVPDTCSACHARPEIMKKYGVPEDRIQTFIESFHGIAIGYGDKAEANCSDCHGVHDILPASDARSRINAANLAKTCGVADCHPGMSEKIATAKIHRRTGSKAGGATAVIIGLLKWALLIVAGMTVVWFVFALATRRRKKS
jgi:hypothetical protein